MEKGKKQKKERERRGKKKKKRKKLTPTIYHTEWVHLQTCFAILVLIASRITLSANLFALWFGNPAFCPSYLSFLRKGKKGKKGKKKEEGGYARFRFEQHAMRMGFYGRNGIIDVRRHDRRNESHIAVGDRIGPPFFFRHWLQMYARLASLNLAW